MNQLTRIKSECREARIARIAEHADDLAVLTAANTHGDPTVRRIYAAEAAARGL